MDLRTAKRIFLTAKQAQNVTGRTLETYVADIDRFFGFVVSKNIFDVSEITAETIREFLKVLKDSKKMRNITIFKVYRELKTLFLFLYREDYINSNPMKTIVPPRVEEKKMRTFTSREISKLLNSFNKEDFFGMRNYSIMCVFFSTGIRKTELLNLKITDLNITNDLLRVFGKGNKERFVPLGRTVRRTLIQYLRMRKEYLGDESCKYLFPSRAKRRLTCSGINMLFQKLKKELQLTGEKVSSHTWRHTFAKNYLLNGGDVFSLQKIMGHSDLETTRGYLSLNDEEMKLQHAKYNPLDNKDWLY
jgi:site-specific recombinase XerD